MRFYVKSVDSNITLVDIDSGNKFSVSAAAIQKLFGELPAQGEVWDYRASRLDDVAESFRKWQVVQLAIQEQQGAQQQQ
jgi:hypothetical protein